MLSITAKYGFLRTRQDAFLPKENKVSQQFLAEMILEF